MSTITVQVSEEEKAFLLAMAELNGVSISELVRTNLIETLENQIDVAIYQQAMEVHQKVNASISHAEMKQELEL